MNREKLHHQIDLFFEAKLTQHEEKALLRQLISHEGNDPTADAALAVMLASRLTPEAPVGRRRPSIKLAAGIAAAIALLISLPAILHHHHRDPQTFAYVSGKKIQDPDEIKNLVATQLRDIGESTDLFSQTLSTDLNDIREALLSEDI